MAVGVDFRLGEMEHLPLADGTVDAIISNCVINQFTLIWVAANLLVAVSFSVRLPSVR
jgi:ubiquinone/menaquinone biosynthesis C-methylase UbiE